MGRKTMQDKQVTEIIDRLKTISTKVDYIIEDLNYIRKYYRLDDIWEG
jgi:hypothetical protein